jgi:two-component system, OmpR family, sensor histidine kinase ChvG
MTSAQRTNRGRRVAWRSRIAVRLLAFNLLLLFLPAAGILYLDVYEARLLEAQERSMVQQARLLAAALSDHDAIESAATAALLSRLGEGGEARLRVYDTSGILLADSNRFRLVQEAAASSPGPYTSPIPGVRGAILYRIGASVAAVRRWLVQSPFRFPKRQQSADEPAVGGGLPQPVRSALAGRYGAATHLTPGQRSLTLSSAVPVRRGHEVIGAVLVSQTTFRSLQALYQVRLRVFEVVVASIFAAAALTALAAATVVRPIVRLRREASDLAERRTRLPGRFLDVDRRDEIGDLARSLAELTLRLDAHIRAVEQFAGDVSHEFRNPLASIRSAAEMAGQADSVEDRDRFLAMLTRDVDRLERLISGVRQLALVDAQVEQEPLSSVDVGQLLGQVVETLRLAEPDRPGIAVSINSPSPRVRATPDRLAQVFENVLANARSFAPADTVVEASLHVEAGDICCVAVSDRGPGIPPGHLDRVFDRFFSYRPASGNDRRHTGLGLAIARTIVHGYGGTISAENRTEGGSRFVIRLPLARDR